MLIIVLMIAASVCFLLEGVRVPAAANWQALGFMAVTLAALAVIGGFRIP